MINIDEIYFCPHTLEFFLNEQNKKNCFVYAFESVYSKINRTILSCCFKCQDLIVSKYNSQVSCFQRYFPEKELN